MNSLSAHSVAGQLGKFQNPQVFSDLNQLNNIRQQGHENQDLALKKVAQQFEAMFMQMMLKSMRAANNVFAKDNPLNSFEMGFRQDMLDDQMSVTMAESGGLGIADVLYKQLSRQYIEANRYQKPQNLEFDNQRAPESKVYDNHDLTGLTTQRITDARKINELETPQDFIDMAAPYAKKVANKIGADYRHIIAQTALETGWGKHMIRTENGDLSFNLFNIKADKRWQGQAVSVPTLEYHNGVAQKEVANFRRYTSIEESFDDYMQFLQQPRYAEALNPERQNGFIESLHTAGYATDPQYSQKINAIVNRYFPDSNSEEAKVSSLSELDRAARRS